MVGRLLRRHVLDERRHYEQVFVRRRIRRGVRRHLWAVALCAVIKTVAVCAPLSGRSLCAHRHQVGRCVLHRDGRGARHSQSVSRQGDQTV